MHKPLHLLALWALTSPGLALAQEQDDAERASEESPASADTTETAATEAASYVGRDLTDRKSSLDTQIGRFQINAFFEFEYHDYNNLDFRALDESTDQSILDSDDRGRFAFTGAALELGYRPDDNTRFVLGASYRGMWGGHQIGNVNDFGGWVFFTSLYAEWSPSKASYQPMLRIGRQRFDLGGMGGAREFIYGNVIDAIRLDFPIPRIGWISTIPFEIVSASSGDDDISFIRYIGQSQMQIFGFRGDRMTWRSGGVFVANPDALPEFDARAHLFYTHVGGLGTGSDITYQGLLGNFSDKDYVVNYGVRASYTVGELVTPFAEFNGSFGIDRKEQVAQDVDTNGFAWSAGAILNMRRDDDSGWGGSAQARYFESQGPAYGSNGLQYSHGYVGMRGRKVGGLIANRFFGWHPTSYSGVNGVNTTEHDTRRRSGTRVVEVRGDIQAPGPISFSAGWWFLQDTGVTNLDPDDLDTITPPFGYSRRQFEAEERLGKVLGNEFNLAIGAQMSNSLSLNLQGAIFLPGEFYEIEISRVAGSALGSPDPKPAWDLSLGGRMRF